MGNVILMRNIMYPGKLRNQPNTVLLDSDELEEGVDSVFSGKLFLNIQLPDVESLGNALSIYLLRVLLEHIS